MYTLFFAFFMTSISLLASDSESSKELSWLSDQSFENYIIGNVIEVKKIIQNCEFRATPKAIPVEQEVEQSIFPLGVVPVVIKNCDFHRSTFQNVTFSNVIFEGNDFSETQFINVTFENVVFKNNYFYAAQIEDSLAHNFLDITPDLLASWGQQENSITDYSLKTHFLRGFWGVIGACIQCEAELRRAVMVDL